MERPFSPGLAGRRIGRTVLAVLGLFAAAASADQGAPHINYVYPAGGRRRTSFKVTVGGQDIMDANAVRITARGVTAEILDVNKPPKPKKAIRFQTGDEIWELATLAVKIAGDAEPGEHDLRLVTPRGVSNRFRFIVGQIPEVNEVEPNSDLGQAQDVNALPVVVNGQIKPMDQDCFRFTAKAGARIVCRLEGRSLLPYIADAVPGWLQAELSLYDSAGTELQRVDDYRFKPDPVLIFEVPEDGSYTVRLRDALYRGRDDFVYRLTIGPLPFITGIFPLGGTRGTEAKVRLYGVNLPQQSLVLKLDQNSPPVIDVTVKEHGLASNSVPFAVDELPEVLANDANDTPDGAMPLQPPVIVNGRIDRPGDIDYFKFHGKAKERVVVDVRARRLDSPLDSVVAILNAQGRQLVENDDTVDKSEGLITHHADSHIEYTLPADGQYIIKLRDVQAKGGDEYAYRLAVGPGRPRFDLRAVPDNLAIPRGGTAALTVHAIRKDGFAGEIEVRFDSLPDGFVASRGVIAAGADQVQLTVTAPDQPALLVATAEISGTAKIGQGIVRRKALPAEDLMQAFLWRSLVPTKELVLSATSPGPLRLVPDVNDAVLEVPEGQSFEIPVKAIRATQDKTPITLKLEGAPKGVTLKRAVIGGDVERVAAVVTVSRQLRAGSKFNLVLSGTTKIGKQTVACIAPAVAVAVTSPPEK